MEIIFGLIYWALQLYFYALLARFGVELIMGLNPGWRPKGPLLPLVEVVLTITDPPLKFVRRFIRPVRIGPVALDFGWTLVVIAVLFLMRIVASL